MAESKQEENGRFEQTCKPCLNKDTKQKADVFCSICNEFQCNDCSNSHTLFVFMKNHKLLSVPEGQIRLASSINMNGIDICKEHNKRFKFFCKDEKKIACSKCAIINHRTCISVDAIEHIIQDEQLQQQQCNTLKEKLQTAITTTKQAVENLNKAESLLNADVQRVPDKLSKLRSDIIEKFDEFAEEVTTVANSYRDKTTEDWAKRKLDCDTKIQTMKESLKTIEDIASMGTPLQQFIRAHSMTETIDSEVKNAALLCKDLRTLNVSCNFDEQFDSFKSNLLSAMKPGEFEMKYSVPRKTKLAPIASIDIKQTDDDEGEPYYSGLDFLPDGRLVVVDNQNDKCLVYDENLNRKSAFKLPYEGPFNVVVVSDEEVAITPGGSYRLDFLHISKSNEITLNRTCKSEVEYDSICMKDDENFVISTINHDTPVLMVSMSGEEKDFDIVFPLKKYETDSSFCTYVRSNDQIVLTDTDADTVYLYDVKTSKQIVIKDRLIMAPSGVAVGPYDHIFAASESTSSLVEITPGGRVLSSHHVDMYNPRYLAVSKDKRKLAVSNYKRGSKKLKVYTIISH